MRSSTPLHIAIIPDGNRRWATKRILKPWEGHRKAVENFRTLTEWCQKDPRIATLTVWCFSTENWKREKEEIAMLMDMLEEYLRKEGTTFREKHTRLLHSGRKDRIPQSLAALIAETEEETKNEDAFTLHLALDYGGKDEVVRAMQALQKSKEITEQHIRDHLDNPELQDIDLIIRTSGEKRTSNFFLWQSAYAEWTFVDKFFPDFDTEDLASAVDEYASRSRRFGL